MNQPKPSTICITCGETYQQHVGALKDHWFSDGLYTEDPSSLRIKKPYDNEFTKILQEMQAMHDKKARDYGGDTGQDNIRASEGFGIPAWLGAIVRLNDKIIRIKSFTKNKNLANESLEDSLIDICVYGVLALQLYREANSK